MKQEKIELDVDFIGGQQPLTQEEDKAITAYIKAAKERRRRITNKAKSRTSKQLKTLS